MVCSKSEGRDISGRSFSFFLFATGDREKQITNLFVVAGNLKKNMHQCMEAGRHVGKATHFCLPQGRWSAGGLSCFSLREPLEAV